MSDYREGDIVHIKGTIGYTFRSAPDKNTAEKYLVISIPHVHGPHTIDELKDVIVSHERVIRVGDKVHWWQEMPDKMNGIVESISKDGKWAFINRGRDMITMEIADLTRE